MFCALLAALTVVNRSRRPRAPRGPDPGAPSGDPVADFQRAVRADPDSAAAYAGLGDAYLQRARETGDACFYSRADAPSARRAAATATNLNAIVGAGTLARLRHDFREQLRLGMQAHALAPGLARPLHGDRRRAGRARPLPRGRRARSSGWSTRSPTWPPTRAPRTDRELGGDLAGAVEAMRLAVSAGGGSPENVAYVQALLGDLELAAGRPAAARAAYLDALRRSGTTPPALVGLARVDAAQRPAAPGDRPAARGPRGCCRSPATSPCSPTSSWRAGREQAARADLTPCGRSSGSCARPAPRPTPSPCSSRPPRRPRGRACESAGRV